jgi:heme exporter protein C
MATTPTRIETAQTGNRDTAIPALQGAWWKWGVFVLMCVVIYGTFFIAKGAKGFVDNGEVARIVFFHVPVAALSSVWYFVGTIYALQYLLSARRQTPDTDAKSAVCMELGFVYCALATITGSIFAYAEWNSFWNWDPRETSIVIMLLLYAAYLVLRGAMAEHSERRARLSAVFSIVALVPGLFLIWVVPRLNNGTLHPHEVLTDASKTSPSYKIVLWISFLAFTMLFTWLFQLRLRAYRIFARRQMRIS